MEKQNNGDLLSPDIKFHIVKKIETHKIIALEGPTLRDYEIKYLDFHKPAGIILFRRNVESATQLGDLIGKAGEILTVDGLPPLVMADHEGGIVSVLRDVIGVPPSPMAIAATGDVGIAEDVARATGDMMRKLGANTVLAPVADCCFDLRSQISGLRSFGSDPGLVADYVASTIRGFKMSGVITCVKHFPGHGSTVDDSHVKLPEVAKTGEELREEDLVPFVRAVDEGVEMVMAAHIVFSMEGVGEKPVPASFNKKVIDDLLRDELGFTGVVVTDALEMAGAQQHAAGTYGGLAAGLMRPLLAGIDLLLHSHPIPEKMFLGSEDEGVMSVEVMETIIKTLERVVDRSRIEKKLEAAAADNEGLRNLLDIFKRSDERIAILRKRVADDVAPAKESSSDKVIDLRDYPSIPNIYEEVAVKSVTVLRDPVSIVPLSEDESYLLVPFVYHESRALGQQDVSPFLDVFSKRFPSWKRTLDVIEFSKDPSGDLLPKYDRRNVPVQETFLDHVPADVAGVIPVFSARGRPLDEFVNGCREFVEDQACPLVIITGWPIHDWVPDETGVVLTFGASAEVGSSVARLLLGEITSQGSLMNVFPAGG